MRAGRKESIAAYDALGSVYDQAPHLEVCEGFYRSIRPLLRDLVGRTVFDLGCGTGFLAERLAAQGCKVVGVDQSRRMLRVARERCRRVGARVRFVRADLRAFRCRPWASAAFASGEVINHIASESQLAAVFANVSAHLERGGCLVFDTLSRWCYETYWANQTYAFQGVNGELWMECDWDPAARVGSARTVAYERHGRSTYRRRESMIRERFFDARTIHQLLKRAGFSKVNRAPWSPWLDQHEEESLDRLLWTAIR
jgi:SAM-dependent methyltransferase